MRRGAPASGAFYSVKKGGGQLPPPFTYAPETLELKGLISQRLRLKQSNFSVGKSLIKTNQNIKTFKFQKFKKYIFSVMALVRRPLGLLIDLSGTIHIEDKVIQGSIEAVNLLRRNEIPFLFVTNTTKVRNECLFFSYSLDLRHRISY